MELRVNALEASLKKVQQMNVLLSQENSIQSRLLGQVSSLLQPRNAVKFCDNFHPNCSISHRRYNYRKPAAVESTNYHLVLKHANADVIDPIIRPKAQETSPLAYPNQTIHQANSIFIRKDVVESNVENVGKDLSPDETIENKLQAMMKESLKNGTFNTAEYLEICKSGILPSSVSQADLSEESENDLPNENDDEFQAMIKEGLKNGMFDPAEFLEVCKSGKLPPSFSQEDLSEERENNMPNENDNDPGEFIRNDGNTSDDDEC